MPKTLLDPVTDFAQAVLDGRELACKFVKWACQRHINDLDRDDIRFDVDEAKEAIEFLSILPHIKGAKAGKPLELEPAQKFIIGSVFGWLKVEDGTRRFRYAYVEIPRKNGKSVLGSGVGLKLLVADGEAGAEVYSAATTRDQAKIVWDVSKAMMEGSAFLSRIIKPYHASLVFGNSVFRPLSADAKRKDGLNPHGIAIDEFHAWIGRAFWDVLISALGAREQPLVFIITTAGVDTKQICYEIRGHALRGIDPNSKYEADNYFCYVSTLDGYDPVFDSKEEQDAKDDWTDPAVWPKANFLLGKGKKRETLAEEVKEAQQMPSKKNDVLTKQFNIWCETGEAWLSVQKWDLNTREVALEELEGKPCCSGLDLSSNTDLTAHCLVFLPGPFPGYLIVPFLYLPEENMRQRMASDRVDYAQWVKKGFIKTTPGDVIDLAFIKHDYCELASRFKILETGFDPWKAFEIANDLTTQGAKMVEMRQGHKTLGYATKKFEELLIKGELLNDGNPALRWMAQNTSVRRDPNENIIPDKQKARMRIDGIVASIMGLDRALRTPGESQYEDQMPFTF